MKIRICGMANAHFCYMQMNLLWVLSAHALDVRYMRNFWPRARTDTYTISFSRLNDTYTISFNTLFIHSGAARGGKWAFAPPPWGLDKPYVSLKI